MTKVINLELSKRLQEVLKEEEPEYAIDNEWNIWELIYAQSEHDEFWEDWYFKTLTLEEAIEFLPKWIDGNKLIIEVLWSGWVIKYSSDDIDKWCLCKVADFTLLEAIEKILTYLLDNNLIEQWN